MPLQEEIRKVLSLCIAFTRVLCSLCFRSSTTLLTLREITMMRLINQLTDKPLWEEKVRISKSIYIHSRCSTATFKSYPRFSTTRLPPSGRLKPSPHPRWISRSAWSTTASPSSVGKPNYSRSMDIPSCSKAMS